MWARLHPRCRSTAVWLVNVDVQPQLDNLSQTVRNAANTENVGGYKSLIYDPVANTIKGRPVITCEYCQSLTTKGDIILADLKSYITGTRGGIESAMSIHLRFDYAESCFRFIFEADGQPWLQSALTPFKGSTTLTSFVTLDAR
jgi:HK97 family phage major capsid protein